MAKLVLDDAISPGRFSPEHKKRQRAFCLCHDNFENLSHLEGGTLSFVDMTQGFLEGLTPQKTAALKQ